MRVGLISWEMVAACALLAAVVVVPPSDLSRAYALIMIVTGVIPGMMLTGDVKMLNAGISTGRSSLSFKTIAAITVNIPIGTAFLLMQEHRQPIGLLIVFIALGTLGATAQTFSSVWYYTQPDKRKILRSKAASACAKVAFATAAVGLSELTLLLVGMTLGAMVEFALNFRSLPWRAGPEAGQRHEVFSTLGLAYGVSRFVSALIKVGLATLLGPLIASFLVIEQLAGGANSMFEKYFVRSTQWRQHARALKVIYLVAMLFLVPWLASQPLSPGDRLSLFWLAIVACASLLPLAEMYVALQRRGQNFVAIGSGVISLCCAALLGLAWSADSLSRAALVAYVALPGFTFLFYWLAGTHAYNDAQR